MQRRFRKQLFAIAREAQDERDLQRRFAAFIEVVRAAPVDERPYAVEVRDTLRALSLRRDLAEALHRTYDDARVGRRQAPAAATPGGAAH